jgi:hypothetical protein
MEERWVLVGDELRMDKVESYEKLIGENGGIVKCYGDFSIDKNNKIVNFVLDCELTNHSWQLDLQNVKLQGFYNPMIKDYVWGFSSV